MNALMLNNVYATPISLYLHTVDLTYKGTQQERMKCGLEMYLKAYDNC